MTKLVYKMGGAREELLARGFVRIPAPLEDAQISLGLSSIRKDGVDYSVLKEFVDDAFVPELNRQLGWGGARYIKFRFSNVSNARDASTFHGDLYDHREIATASSPFLPVYTALVYFDDAEVEVIPGSHDARWRAEHSASESFQYRERVSMSAGDVLVFRANLHHRGIFHTTPKGTNRRLLQVFDVFPDEAVWRLEKPKILVVLTTETFIMKLLNPLNEWLSGRETSNDVVTKLHYSTMYNDWQYRAVLSDISEEDKRNRYVSYVPGDVGVIKRGCTQPWNVNIIIDEDHEWVRAGLSSRSFVRILSVVLLVVAIFLVIRKKRREAESARGALM